MKMIILSPRSLISKGKLLTFFFPKPYSHFYYLSDRSVRFICLFYSFRSKKGQPSCVSDTEKPRQSFREKVTGANSRGSCSNGWEMLTVFGMTETAKVKKESTALCKETRTTHMPVGNNFWKAEKSFWAGRYKQKTQTHNLTDSWTRNVVSLNPSPKLKQLRHREDIFQTLNML